MRQFPIVDEGTGEVIHVVPALRTSMNYNEVVPIGVYEKETGPSMTVPDMSLSVSELLERHTRGLPIPQFVPTYTDEEHELESIDFLHLDLTEQDELRDHLKESVASMQEKLRIAREAQEASIRKQNESDHDTIEYVEKPKGKKSGTSVPDTDKETP